MGTSFEKISREAFSRERSIQPPSRTPAQVLKDVIGDLSDSKRAWTKFEVLRGALMKGVPQVTATELQTDITREVKAGRMLAQGAFYTVPAVLKREAAVIEQWRRGQLRGAVIADSAPHRIIDGFKPTSGQQAAADLMVSARALIIGVWGYAGDRVMTTQQYCLTPYGDDNTVLIVDESSMLGTKSMENILSYANSRNLAKVVLMGDVNQLGSIEAGTPFADLQRAGMQTAHVDQIIRQKVSRHRQAVSQLAKGDIERGLQLFAPEIFETDQKSMNSKAAQLWAKTKDAQTPIIVQTNAQKLDINNAIKASLGQTSKGVTHKIWRPVHMSKSERARAETYEAGTHIRFNRDIKRFKIKRGQIFKIKAIARRRHGRAV